MMKRKMHKVMEEFKAGTLRSSSGQKVTEREQAMAIGMALEREAMKGKRHGKMKPKGM